MNEDLVPLERALNEGRFGGKSVRLGALIRQGLPVPPGWALSCDLARAVTQGSRAAIEQVLGLGDAVPGLLAVRSSAVGEDSQEASFAGQHLTLLGVSGAHDLVSAVLRVERSGAAASAMAYRRASGGAEQADVAVAVQHLLDPECAGVMFTLNPMTGADERIVEAAWGLGEVVVASRVSPDSYRFARGGGMIESAPGDKHLSLHPLANGGVEEQALSPERARQLCLQERDLAALDTLADACEATFGGPQDIEWAKAEGRIWLLQARPITRGRWARTDRLLSAATRPDTPSRPRC